MKNLILKLPLNIVRFRYVLLLLMGLVLADGFITQFLVGSGIAWEGNPLLRGLAATGNLTAVKIIGSLVCALLLVSIRRHQPRMASITAWSFIGIYTLIVYWNIAVIGIGMKI